MTEPSLPAVLHERAGLQPDDTAFTFVDYEQDESGVATSLAWSQLYRRTLNVANELGQCASPGDRAVICAPQGLEYIVAFLGALQAGLIAVPLSVPLGGAADERVSSVLRDASPSLILTTSAVAGAVVESVKSQSETPSVVEVDLLDLDRPGGTATMPEDRLGTAFLQYTPRAATVRIVDPETRAENPAGKVGEVWVDGDNVTAGYWRNPQASEDIFGAKLVAPSPGTPEGPWLRTGDSGFFYDDELFIVGRIKDLLTVYGRNHSPDDIEATVQEVTGGRCAAIAESQNKTEKLVVIIEQEAGRLPGGRDGETRRHQGRVGLGDIEVARSECGRSRSGRARLDPHHHKRQGQARNVRRAVPQQRVPTPRPLTLRALR